MPSDVDYNALGFKCGIEIHQQLDTGTKLFCNCATDPENESPSGTVKRLLRPVPSEIGEIDQAAQYEYLKDKEFIYNMYNDRSCLVELDEEPPHPVNQDALHTALVSALLMNCTIPDEIHFMRKTVIDGSNTAGFQRTAVIGMDGSIDTDHGTVAIEDIELEEESAGIARRDQDQGVFDLDRLGIPLIEVGTDASITGPAHAKEVAETIGMLLRSTMQVKRGIGTVRQDVNVSIEGGARVEIKGFQELERLDTLIENEVERQRSLIALMDELDETVGGEIVDVTALFESTENDIIERILESDGAVYAFLLHGLDGELKHELCPGLTVGRELADHAQAHGVKGIIHTDEDLSRYGLEDEFDAVADELGQGDGDAVVVLAETSDIAEQAAQAVVDRANQLAEAVPEETRTAEGVVTRYARPLPGEARMYPETDIPPMPLDQDDVEQLQNEVPETLVEKEERLQDVIGTEMAAQIVNSEYIGLFERLMEQEDVAPEVIANILTNVVGDLRSRDNLPVDRLTADDFEAAVRAVAADEISTGQVRAVLKAVITEDTAVEAVVDRIGGQDEDEIRAVVQDVIADKQELIEEQGERAQGALMGVVMDRLDGADGAAVSRILREELERRQ